MDLHYQCVLVSDLGNGLEQPHLPRSVPPHIVTVWYFTYVWQRSTGDGSKNQIIKGHSKWETVTSNQ